MSLEQIKELVERGQRAQSAVDALVAPAPELVIVREWVCVLKRRDARALPIGTHVLVQRDNGTMLETVTLALPRDLGGQPVVDLQGLDEPYCMHLVYCPTR
jgi:hypothetical protein